MECKAIRSSPYTVTVLLVVGLLRCGSVVGAPSSGVDHTPVTSQELPHNPGRSLTAIMGALAPGAKAASHRHAGIVFASVLEGTVRSQLDGGDVIEYSAGQRGVEPPGTGHTRTENPSQTMPARPLAVFIAPTGAQLTTVDKERCQELDPIHCGGGEAMKEDPAAQARALTRRMHAVRVHQFGGLEAIVYEEVSRPVPGAGQVLVRVKAAGVGPWDAWVRAGKSVLPQPLPLVLGSDLAGIIEEVGPGISHFRPGEAVFGVTNAQFTGAYAEYAVADAARIAPKPRRLSDVEAASVPVVASTAWQMVFDYGHLDSTKRVLVHGAAGNVGAYAVQLAKRAGAEVIATAYTHDVEEVRTLHADHVIDVQTARFEDRVKDVDVVLDTVGGETLDRSFAVLKPGGVLVSAVVRPDQDQAARHHVRGVFFLVSVTSEGLTKLAELLEAGHLTPRVGDVLPLAEVRLAHEMLAGKPHKPGKIVLAVSA